MTVMKKENSNRIKDQLTAFPLPASESKLLNIVNPFLLRPIFHVRNQKNNKNHSILLEAILK